MPKRTNGRPSKRTKPKTKTKAPAATKAKAVAKTSDLPVKLPNVLELAKSSWLIMWRNRRTVSFMVLIYGLVYLVLVLGLSSPSNANSLKQDFSGVSHGHLGSLYSGIGVFTFLVGSSASSSTASGSAYQVFILIIASLSIIWALREFYKGVNIRARDGYYKGLYPLAQYILVILFIALELLPLVIGLGLYGLLVAGGITTTGAEKLVAIILAIGLAGLSLYLISSSVIAMYIVALPNMTPLKALRSAKGLTKGRRWSVLRKMIFLPLLLLIVTGVIILPFILIVPVLASWIFYILTLFALVYIHSYLYALYRGLINE